jgi:branched-chain amino acid aminotransferase
VIVWHNGALVEGDRPVVTAADRGLRYAQGVFDTLLLQDGAALDAAAHLARLARHAAVLSIPLPFTADAWRGAIADLTRANGAGAGRWALTTLVTGGPGPRGLAPPPEPAPTAIISITPAPEPRPLRAIVATSTRRNARSPLARVKATAGYADAMLVLAEARAAGADEAILLNTEGRLACCTIGNLVAEIGGALVTPPLEDGAIDGITRGGLIAQGRLAERGLTEADVRSAQALYLCNSLRGLSPLSLVPGA